MAQMPSSKRQRSDDDWDLDDCELLEQNENDSCPSTDAAAPSRDGRARAIADERADDVMESPKSSKFLKLHDCMPAFPVWLKSPRPRCAWASLLPQHWRSLHAPHRHSRSATPRVIRTLRCQCSRLNLLLSCGSGCARTLQSQGTITIRLTVGNASSNDSEPSQVPWPTQRHTGSRQRRYTFTM